MVSATTRDGFTLNSSGGGGTPGTRGTLATCTNIAERKAHNVFADGCVQSLSNFRLTVDEVFADRCVQRLLLAQLSTKCLPMEVDFLTLYPRCARYMQMGVLDDRDTPT
eukprot:5619053-Pyramimonas_sp.AAC.1